MADAKDAFVLRISHRDDALSKALESNDLIIGWSKADGLTNPDLDWNEFREIVHQEYYSDHDNYRKAGASAGNLWRFIREMKEGDLVVVPDGSEFYVAEVTGDERYEPERIEEDTAHRRSVRKSGLLREGGSQNLRPRKQKGTLLRTIRTAIQCLIPAV